MGQSTSSCKDFIPDTVDAVQFQVTKHSKILSELNDLTFEQFQSELKELNELSRKCIDQDGNQLVFAIHKGSYIQWLWKATIKIACVSVNPESRKISQIKLINLKQFLHVFNTMVLNLEAITASEEHQRSANSSPRLFPTNILNQFDSDKFNFDSSDDDCIICMERQPEVILPCLHSFCTLCIEQWNENGKNSCPVCSHELDDISDSFWVPLEVPKADEINEEICQQLQKLSQQK